MKLEWVGLLVVLVAVFSINLPGPVNAKCKFTDFAIKRGIHWSSTQTDPSGSTTYPIAQSSGTSGCGNKSVSLQWEKLQFMSTHSDRLAVEMARGGGQYSDSLATLLGCPSSLHPRFSSLARGRYAWIFPGYDRTPKGLLARVDSLVVGDPVLGEGCRLS